MNRIFGFLLSLLITASTLVVADDNQTTAGGFTGPASLTVTCGDVRIRIDGPKLWTPSRIEYQGTILGIEESAYGTVFNLEGVGFIGSAHRDIETEQIIDVRFLLDGEKISGEQEHVNGRSFRCERRSRVRDLELYSTVEIADGRLTETARIQANNVVRLAKIYHFMHAWIPAATHYAYGKDGKIIESGEFSNSREDDRKFYFQKNPDWVAVFDANSDKGAVSYLLEHPETGGASMQLWNCLDVYRKFYFVTFVDEVMPARFEGTYRMTTEFFTSTSKSFTEDSTAVAAELANAK
ncbi:MAG: hypothetical protein O2955_12160 [Planctomycetota bacterium]|nr:hypothetical protein [Planctomycetota bacterium]MDA1213265.1 hypothetical protein [Planctomycetota bacterium]